MGEIVSSVSLHFVAGDDLLLEFTVTLDGAAVDITGMTPRFVVSRSGTDVLITGSTATATITDGANGVYRVAVDEADTAGLAGTYDFQSEVEDSSGDKSTVARGYITFANDLIP